MRSSECSSHHSSAAFGAFNRSYDHCRNLIGFRHQRLRPRHIGQMRSLNHLQPICALVSFLFHNAQLRDEIGSRSSSTRSSIVGTD